MNDAELVIREAQRWLQDLDAARRLPADRSSAPYGEGMETFWVFDVHFHPKDETLLVRFKPIMRDQNILEVVEEWQVTRP